MVTVIGPRPQSSHIPAHIAYLGTAIPSDGVFSYVIHLSFPEDHLTHPRIDPRRCQPGELSKVQGSAHHLPHGIPNRARPGFRLYAEVIVTCDQNQEGGAKAEREGVHPRELR